MALPPLHKYLDVRGAKLTLGNRCLRFAKPSEFKDDTDMKAEGLFPDELEKALVILADGFVDAREGVLGYQSVLRTTEQ